MPNKPSLSEIQARFTKLLKAPRLNVSDIRGSEGLFAPARDLQVPLKTRLGIYRYAYFARIEESLADDFPELKEALGEKNFSKLIRHYLKGYPSRYPGLAQIGKNLPAFLAELEEPIGSHDVAPLIEKAKMEWARCLCQWSENAEPTHFAKLLDLPEDERLKQKLVLSPNAQFVPSTTPGFCTIVFYKVRNEVKNQELSPSMEKLLGEIRKGRTLSELILMLENSEQPALQWISNWVAEGLIVGF